MQNERKVALKALVKTALTQLLKFKIRLSSSLQAPNSYGMLNFQRC